MSRGAYILSVIVMKQRIIGCRTILSVLLVAAGAAAVELPASQVPDPARIRELAAAVRLERA